MTRPGLASLLVATLVATSAAYTALPVADLVSRPATAPAKARLTLAPSEGVPSVGDVASARFVMTGATGRVSYRTASALPTGTALCDDGRLGGTHREQGSFPVTVMATDAAGRTVQTTTTLDVRPAPPSVVVQDLRNAPDMTLEASIKVVSGEIVGWRLADGPPWLSIDDGGVVEGVPPPGTRVVSFKVVGFDPFGREATVPFGPFTLVE